MQVVNKVLSKWNKKTELANHKISLNLQADINKVLDEMEDSIEILGAADDLRRLNQKVKLAMDEYDEAAAEYERDSNNAKSDVTNAKQVKKKVEEIAKDLGVDPNGVKNYKNINAVIDELEKYIKYTPAIIKELGNFK